MNKADIDLLMTEWDHNVSSKYIKINMGFGRDVDVTMAHCKFEISYTINVQQLDKILVYFIQEIVYKVVRISRVDVPASFIMFLLESQSVFQYLVFVLFCDHASADRFGKLPWPLIRIKLSPI